MNKKMRIGKMTGLILALAAATLVQANDVLHLADSLYLNHRYGEASRQYQQILENDRYLQQNFELNFKFAVCLFRNNELASARTIFERLQQNHYTLRQYVDYFLFLLAVKEEDYTAIDKISATFFRDYSRHFLADSLLFYLADFEFSTRQYSAANRHYSGLLTKKNYSTYRPLFLARIAQCRYYLGEEADARDRMYQVMKLYPESAEAREIANGFDNYEKQDDKLFFTIVEVYLQNREYNLLTRKLELYIIRTPNPALKEKARFYLLQIYFEQGQYQSALYGFKNLLAGLHNEALRPRVCLMMARCYLYLGKRNEAAEQYLQYAKLFPRRRVAAESIWKAGWIYEDLGKLSTAEKLYQDLIRQWPRSDFAWEARFRRGLIPYRLDQFDRAIGAFKEIAGNQESLFQQHRGRYWLAKTYQKMGRQRLADSLFIGLGKELFDSYYAAKSYTMYHSLIDSLLDLPEKLAAANNPLKPYVESIGLWLADFEDVFAIREILGDDFALQEISENYHQPGSLKEWVALAEMYKRFGAYNRSFRIYDYINQKYFTDVASIDKPFLLKEYYPFYYDHLIATYCSKRNLDSRLVLALIREESAYDRQIRSYANAYGLMQIIPVTALEIAGDLDIEFSKPENLFNAELNINMGTYYLRKLLNRYDDTIEFALAAYNAGPHRVNRWKKIDYNDEMDIFIENIEFQQTRNYVRRVMKNYLIYSILDNIKY